MAKQVVKGALIEALTNSWMKRIPQKGYSYLEILRELERRKKGDYILPPEMRNDVFQAGVHRLFTQFAISAVLSELMEGFELTPDQLISLFGCQTNDQADVLLACMLNPYVKSDASDISNHDDVDALYPGKDVQR